MNELSGFSEGETKQPRPALIGIICILSFLGFVFSIPKIFSPATRAYGTWFPPVFALNQLLGLIAFIGMWKMRKWGVVIYTIGSLGGLLVLSATGHLSLAGIIIALIFIALVIGINLKYFSRMRW